MCLPSFQNSNQIQFDGSAERSAAAKYHRQILINGYREDTVNMELSEEKLMSCLKLFEI